jgi:hypothetical protein
MRQLLVLLALAGCNPKASKDAQMCAQAAKMFAQCETVVGPTKIDRELVVDRWRGLCRAVMTGETDQLLPDGLELYYSMDEPTRLDLQKQAECTARATNCTEYAVCEK